MQTKTWKSNVQTVNVFFWTFKSNESENGSVETGLIVDEYFSLNGSLSISKGSNCTNTNYEYC